MRNVFEALSLGSDTAVMIMSPWNMRYFSGFSGGEGYVFIMHSKKYIIVDSRYTGAAMEEALSGFEVLEYNAKCPLKMLLRGIAADNKIRFVVFEEDYVSCIQYDLLKKIFASAELFPAADKINRLRMIKTEEEISLIAKAEEIGVQAFKHILDYIKPGIAENEIAAELEYFMRKQGAQKTSFETIVLCGERCALPHGVPSDRCIRAGEAVLMDFGCVYDGYCSDMTRTVFVGKASEEYRTVYETVRRAQQCGLEAIRAGISGCEADRAARRIIQDAGYGEYFGHSLGHGVGLKIHELPNLSPSSDIILEENMIVSCEPGIYIYGKTGVRIEDLVCVKNSGIRNLTNLTHELIEL